MSKSLSVHCRADALYSGSKFIAVNYNTNAEYVLSVRTAATAAASTLVSRFLYLPFQLANLYARLLVLVLALRPNLL